jgi:hypothetical protein
VVSNICDGDGEKKWVFLMGCVVEEEWRGWMLRNLSATYWVIVIRPQLSRTATIDIGYTSNRPSLSILNRSMHKTLASLVT